MSEPLPPRLEVVDVRRIWDAAPHGAFTDLIRHQDRWLCAFREAETHHSRDGVIRVIASTDGGSWTSEAVFAMPGIDLRDPKLSVHGRLTLSCAAVYPPGGDVGLHTIAWLTDDAMTWDPPIPVGDPGFWLWRLTWYKERAYGVAYATQGESLVRLYASADGQNFRPLVSTLFDRGVPSEGSLLFLADDSCLCLLRRDGPGGTAQLGRSCPPYTDWAWRDLGVKLGGPQLIALPDGRILAAGRTHEGAVRTSLLWLDVEEGTATAALELPSGGDTSYPGLVWHDGLLWVSYYSSHDGKSSIYLAKVGLSSTP